MDNINLMLGIKLATKSIRQAVLQEQMRNNVSNEAMCVILKDMLVDFQDAVTSEYASALSQVISDKAKESEEDNKEEKEDADS